MPKLKKISDKLKKIIFNAKKNLRDEKNRSSYFVRLLVENYFPPLQPRFIVRHGAFLEGIPRKKQKNVVKLKNKYKTI